MEEKHYFTTYFQDVKENLQEFQSICGDVKDI